MTGREQMVRRMRIKTIMRTALTDADADANTYLQFGGLGAKEAPIISEWEGDSARRKPMFTQLAQWNMCVTNHQVVELVHELLTREFLNREGQLYPLADASHIPFWTFKNMQMTMYEGENVLRHRQVIVVQELDAQGRPRCIGQILFVRNPPPAKSIPALVVVSNVEFVPYTDPIPVTLKSVWSTLMVATDDDDDPLTRYCFVITPARIPIIMARLMSTPKKNNIDSSSLAFAAMEKLGMNYCRRDIGPCNRVSKLTDDLHQYSSTLHMDIIEKESKAEVVAAAAAAAKKKKKKKKKKGGTPDPAEPEGEETEPGPEMTPEHREQQIALSVAGVQRAREKELELLGARRAKTERRLDEENKRHLLKISKEIGPTINNIIDYVFEVVDMPRCQRFLWESTYCGEGGGGVSSI
jgi:hypothetical protein